MKRDKKENDVRIKITDDIFIDIMKNKEDMKIKDTYSSKANAAIFYLFSEFFNFIKEKEVARNAFKITDLHFIVEDRLVTSLYMEDSLCSSSVLFKYLGIDLFFNFNSYKHNSELFYDIHLTSESAIKESIDDIYFDLLGFAIKTSNLKGNYFKFSDSYLEWDIIELEKRNFGDIFLPDSQIEDIKLFVNIFKKTGKMLRYLFSGNPGTCKTESTLVIANELKNLGVTIIKMNPTDMLLDKIKLAELLSPSLIIFDDIDLNLGSRQHGNYNKNLKNFLDIFDGTEKIQEGVGIIATSNSIELLDIAAKRPGRFDRILSFDELTKDNIKNIILKSLKYNFDYVDTTGIYVSDSIINLFYTEKVTGAHVYNTIKSLKLRSDINDIKLNNTWLLEEIKKDINTINTIKKLSKDKLGVKNEIGFQFDRIPQGIIDSCKEDFGISERID